MAKPIPKASEEDTRLGWIRGIGLIREIEKRTHEAGYPAGMEETQEVINVLIDMGYLEQDS